MEPHVSNITVVGGGTAGWLTALMLHSRLNRARSGPPVRISLIESPTVPTVGVGEGSLFGLSKEFERLGLDEEAFVRRCNATFKLGVRFVGWNSDERGTPYEYIHPVSYGIGALGGKNPLLHYLAFSAHPGRDPQIPVDSIDAIVEAIRCRRAPRTEPRPTFKGDLFNYAYHFDAARLAEYLRDFAIERGIQHLLDDVDDAVVGEHNIISHLRLRQNGLLPVELVIDCTGFRGLIISKILGEPFQDYASNLLCDRAVPIQMPYRRGEDIENSTTATALSAGWVWRIPLFNRIGTGYVYSSGFISDDDAVRELCRHLAIDPDKHQPRVIPMRVGRVRRAWVGNCIAIGLAGGFTEPLEATAIMTSMATAYLLTQHYPTRSMPEALRAQFNRRVDALYDGVRDFLVMHYYLATRAEPFWQAARAPTVLSDKLRENLELWRQRLPDDNDLVQPRIFSHISYGFNLAAKGFFRGRTMFYQANVSRADWARYGAHLEGSRQRIRRLPSVRDLLLAMRAEERWSHGADPDLANASNIRVVPAASDLTERTAAADVAGASS